MTDYPSRPIDVEGRCDDPNAEPLHGLQYGVRTGNDEPDVYGDQSWVASGHCTRDGSWPGAEIMVRDVTVTYGPWRTHIPAVEPYTEDRETHHTGCPYRHGRGDVPLTACICRPSSSDSDPDQQTN